MAGKVDVKIDTRKVDAYLKGIDKNVKNAVPILRALFNTHGFRDIMQHFRDEKGPSGKWEPRAQSTQDFYRAIQTGRRKPPPGTPAGSFRTTNKILQLTGQLRKSFLPSNIKKKSRQAILFFSNDPKSGRHEFGDKKRRLPERSFMWLSKRAQGNMAKSALRMIAPD